MAEPDPPLLARLGDHLLALVVYAGGAYSGLFVYQLAGGILRWITPFWWGREGRMLLLLSALAVAACVLPCYLVTRGLLHRAWMARLPRRYELAALLAAGSVQGFLLWPISDWGPYYIAALRVAPGAHMLARIWLVFGVASLAGAMFAALAGALACYVAARLHGRL